MTEYPHNDYITAVDTAITSAGLQASTAEWGAVSDGETFDAVFTYKPDHPHVDTGRHPHGVLIFWGETCGWQHAALIESGHTELPVHLPVPFIADPPAVAAAVRSVLAGEAGQESTARWEHADRLAAALIVVGDDPAGGGDGR